MADYLSAIGAASPYLAYYRRKYGVAGARPSAGRQSEVGASLRAEQLGAQGQYDSLLGQAVLAAQETGQRRQRLAQEQGVGASGDLTDSVVQDAATMERRRRGVGRNRAASFLSASQSLLAGGL